MKKEFLMNSKNKYLNQNKVPSKDKEKKAKEKRKYLKNNISMKEMITIKEIGIGQQVLNILRHQISTKMSLKFSRKDANATLK